MGEVNERNVINEKDCVILKHTYRLTISTVAVRKSAILGHEASYVFFHWRNFPNSALITYSTDNMFLLLMLKNQA